jgi:ATP-dependent exoDNAse (exonuclease V) beta subunit
MIDTLGPSRQPIEELSGIARDKIVLPTIHGSKGLEYTAMFICAFRRS